MKPVLLIHGIWDSGHIFRRLALHLQQHGWEPHALSLHPNNGDAGIDTLAPQITAYAEKHFQPHQKFDLIGFSLGGLVARYYLQRLDGIHRVRRFLTISTPHNGTWTAFFLNNTGSKQMRPNSPFLRELNRDAEMLKQLHFTSLWTPFDLMVIPASSSKTPHAIRNTTVPVPLHPWMLIDPRCHSIISQFLEN